MIRTRRTNQVGPRRYRVANLFVCATMFGLALLAHSAIIGDIQPKLLRDFLAKASAPERARTHGKSATRGVARLNGVPARASELPSANVESPLYSTAPSPVPPAGDLDFGNQGSLLPGAACSTSTSCTLVGGIYTTGLFNIPAGVIVQVTGNVPLQVSATTITIDGTLSASEGVAGGGAGGLNAGDNGGGGYKSDGTQVANGGQGVPQFISLGGGGGGGNGGGGGSGGAYDSNGGGGGISGAGGDGIGPNVAGGSSQLGYANGNPGQGGAGGGNGAGGPSTCCGISVGGTGGGGVTGAQGDPQITVFAGGGGGGHGGGGCQNCQAGPNFGGPGGAGGGAVRLSAASVMTINGSLLANGQGGTPSNCASNGGYGGCGGGGAGGTIWLSAPTMVNNGSVQAIGGDGAGGGGGWAGGGGGGAGRIRVDTGNGVAPSGTFTPAIGYTGTLLNPVPHIDPPLVPVVVPPGSGPVTVAVRGAHFVSGAQGQANGQNRTTTFVNAHEIQIEMVQLDLVSATTIPITVVNPTPGGGKSNTALFHVVNSIPFFTLAQSTSLSVFRPRSMVIADFNGDGIPDVATTNGFPVSVNVYLGVSSGGFSGPGTFPTPSEAYWIETGDFNGDNKLDLAVAIHNQSSSGVTVLLGNGDGTFGSRTDYLTGSFTESVALGDYNRDGSLDIAVSNSGSNTISILPGNGDGTFGAKVDLSTSSTHILVAGDFNGDGILDLATSRSSPIELGVFLGNGDGTFGAPIGLPAAPFPYEIAAADLNADGKLDLAAANPNSDTVSVFLGNGDGTFAARTDYASGGSAPFAVNAGDFDMDGLLDLVVNNNSSSNVALLRGIGAGTFGAPTPYPTAAGPFGMATGDFNRDGRLDLASADFTGNTVTIFLNLNQPPVANAGTDQLVQAGALFTLDGTASFDPDNGDSIVSYEWRLNSNVVGNTATLQQTAGGVGVYTYTLTVTDTSGLTGSDTVDITVQDTIPPTVTVVKPNGGEKLFTNSPYYISWTATDNGPISFFDVFYSTNGGGTYTQVPGCSGVDGTLRSCVWYAPGPTTTTGRIKVVATDTGGRTGMDASNANYSVVAGAGTITVTAPNTAVDWGIGTTQKITWTHNMGITSYVQILVSRDGRETWQVVAASVKNNAATTGTYNWVVTGPVSAAARIQVVGVDIPVGDMSNVDFTLSDPYVAVTAPAATSANFGYGTRRTQTWTTNLGPLDKVDVFLSTDGGATCPVTQQIGSNVIATNKTLTYTVPTLGLASANARICIQWTSNRAVQGVNPVNFHVEAPYIHVTFPNVATDAVTNNTMQTVTWANNLGGSENVKIEITTDNGASWTTLVSSTPSTGSKAVLMPATPGASARIRITWLKIGTSVSDESAQNFPIN